MATKKMKHDWTKQYVDPDDAVLDTDGSHKPECRCDVCTVFWRLRAEETGCVDLGPFSSVEDLMKG
jgi:hypothetical protein